MFNTYKVIKKYTFLIIFVIVVLIGLIGCSSSGDSKVFENNELITNQDYDIKNYIKKGFEFFRNKNYTKAVEYFKLAAEQGDSEAQRCLGSCYMEGNGVEQEEEIYYNFFWEDDKTVSH